MSTRKPRKFDAARIADLRDRVRQNPADGEAWLELAGLLANGPAKRELYHALEQAMKSQPESEEAWLLAARIQLRDRGPRAALTWLQDCVRDNPSLSAPRRAAAAFRTETETATLWARADALRQSARWEQALALYRRIERHQPNEPNLLNNIGSCLASLEEFHEADECFRRALSISPDFAQARLNLGLLDALTGRMDPARSALSEVLQKTDLDCVTRRAAGNVLELLDEHERLSPSLHQALQTDDIGVLQRALNETPDHLKQPHGETIARLEALANRFGRTKIDARAFRHEGPIDALPFLEAYAQCNLDEDDKAMAKRYRHWLKTSPEKEMPEPDRRVRHMAALNQERAEWSASHLQGLHGEAWLKYWHARLLSEHAQDKDIRGMPGQYKVAANAIKNLPLTPPEYVSGTYRELLGRILASMEAGPQRAIFMFVAVTMVHGFIDGNGRLGRFMLSAELEAAGLPAIAVPPAQRTANAKALDAAWIERDVHPITDAIRAAHAATARLLRLVR